MARSKPWSRLDKVLSWGDRRRSRSIFHAFVADSVEGAALIRDTAIRDYPLCDTLIILLASALSGIVSAIAPNFDIFHRLIRSIPPVETWAGDITDSGWTTLSVIIVYHAVVIGLALLIYAYLLFMLKTDLDDHRHWRQADHSHTHFRGLLAREIRKTSQALRQAMEKRPEQQDENRWKSVSRKLRNRRPRKK